MNSIDGVIVSMSPRMRSMIVDSNPNRVKPNTIKFVFVVSPLRTQHYGERAETGWLGIIIMCPSRATCLSANCYSVT